MNSKKQKKIIRRALARHGMFFISWLVNIMPYSWVKCLIPPFNWIGYRCTKRHRKVARESMQIAFGKDKDPQEIERLIKKCFMSLGRGMVELLYFQAHPQLAKEKVSIEGIEHLDNALNKGHGVLAVSGHFGIFPLMFLRFALEGYPVTTIRRITRDPKIEEYLKHHTSRLGLKTIYSVPRNKCVRDSIRVLRNNEMLFMLLDQNAGTGGLFVDFFGQQAATSPGFVVFSKRTNAVILPMFILRAEDDLHRIVIKPAVELEKRDSDEEMIKATVQKVTKMIEGYVKEYPHEWSWMHRRWKSRPPDVQVT